MGEFFERVRGEGKSVRTRARLMDAAAEVFARTGIEAASINGIAQAADVSNGTFYNHFKDKDELVASVVFDIAHDFAARIDAAAEAIEDAAERVSFGTRQMIELAANEPDWGQSLRQAFWIMPELRREVAVFARADLERGVRDGVFRVEVDAILEDVMISTVLMGIHLRVSEGAGSEVGSKIAEHQLRLLGVTPARAHRAAYRPIESLVA